LQQRDSKLPDSVIFPNSLILNCKKQDFKHINCDVSLVIANKFVRIATLFIIFYEKLTKMHVLCKRLK
jgi:hypothetical protein